VAGQQQSQNSKYFFFYFEHPISADDSVLKQKSEWKKVKKAIK